MSGVGFDRSQKSERPIVVGVIGLGVGARHVAGYKAVSGVEVRAVCDLNAEHMKVVADQHDIPERHTDWRQVAGHPDLNVVSVCSYDDCHAEQCVVAFKSDKHVLVEKPVSLYRHEAEEVLRAQQDSGRLLTSNLILRQSPRFRELKRQVEDGAFGEIFCIEGDYIHDILWKITEGWRGMMAYYSTVFGGGIHLIDLMRWLLGQDVSEVAGMGNKILTRGTAYRFDDTFITLLRFQGGALGKCLSTYGPKRTKFHALNVYGTKRTFLNDMPHGKMFTGARLEDETVVTAPYPGVEKGDLIPDFVDAIRAGRQPNVNHVDVFRVMDVCFAIMEAVEQRRTVSVSYLI